MSERRMVYGREFMENGRKLFLKMSKNIFFLVKNDGD